MIQSKIWVFIYMFSTTYCHVCRDGCKQGRIQGLVSADCFNQNLREVPDCLSKNTEVHSCSKILDLSLNRIREISESDLDNYGYLQILYLADNTITNMSNAALRDKTYLHTLDVSYNAFYNIPKAIFQLPSLQKLYMSHIESPRMVEDIEQSKPIESPLHYLDLSYNKLQRLPDLGTLPTLTVYNISGNKNIRLSRRNFASLCKLEVLINEDCDRFNFEKPCECSSTELWLRRRNVTFTSFGCELRECAEPISFVDTKLFEDCLQTYQEQQLKLYTTKLLTNLAIGASVIILLLLCVLFYIVRRKRKKNRNNPQMLG